ncbi:copper transporter [Brevibacillus composti]|uniref:Copper transporter n=1 Tax=Brevibacillus composti TaxID=2796470 RepID=A0A7T5JM22_9BACL|nr:copper transporter [Brevibacillus composti]QQE72868.1 copper transporter [Brevibacillus composti]QUO39946.1 copper transporter [Brevibacillus composti]
MIPFRHHLISLAAVFLSLGIGILLGGMTGQSWFSFNEQEWLSQMEKRYHQALKSNQELKQQINRLLAEMEKNNTEAAHLMAVRYADAMQGKRIYVWHEAEAPVAPLRKLLERTGLELVPYKGGGTAIDGPLLAFGGARPAWLDELPEEVRWLHLDQLPQTFSQQWELLDRLQKMLTEMKTEREKS